MNFELTLPHVQFWNESQKTQNKTVNQKKLKVFIKNSKKNKLKLGENAYGSDLAD